MKILYALTACLLLVPAAVRAQDMSAHDGGHNGHTHHHEYGKTETAAGHGHHHDRNEIGVSFGALYGLDDKQWGAGIHVHYFRTLGEHSKWSVGAFAEQAWIDRTHFSFGAGARYAPMHRLSFGVFPGLTTARHSHEHDGHSHNEGWRTRFSMHFEAVCDLFYWDHFHLGPAVDFSWTREDSHFMLGVHGAFCF